MSQDASDQGPGQEKRSRVGGYEILAKLGQGGMGAVFKARQVSVDRVVALKILPPRLAKNEEYVARFFREARSAAKLNHPNIVQAIDAGEADGYHYFAMEFVDGRAAADLLQEGTPLPQQQALEIACDVGRALEYAHKSGIIHRDVKPANILLTADGRAKLADLGLAREATGAPTDLTQTGYAIGTPDYISPEQVRGEGDLDARSDVYSLGATLFHMLVGRPPYAGGTANEVMAKHLAEPAPSVHKANPQVSHAVARIIWKAMAKDRARRYQTAGQMVTDIEQILTPAPGAAGAAGPAAATPPARRKVAAWLGGAVVAAAAVVIAVAALRNDGPENGNGGPPHHTTTPGTADQKSKDEKLLAYLRDFRDAHPTQYRQVITKYQENLPHIQGRIARQRAQDDLDAVLRHQREAAATEFAKLDQRAKELAGAGNYDGAIAQYGKADPELAAILRKEIDTARKRWVQVATSRLDTAITRAEKQSDAGKPEAALAILDEVAGLTYAAYDERLKGLRAKYEKQTGELAKTERQRALTEINALLDGLEAAVAKHDFAGAARLAEAAADRADLKAAERERTGAVEAGRALGRAGVLAALPVVKVLERFRGQKVDLRTKTGPVSGTLLRVTPATAVIQRRFKIGDRWETREQEVLLANLQPETIERLRPKWEPKPGAEHEHIAAAIIALAAEDPDAMNRALSVSKGHVHYARYETKLGELRRRLAQLAADRAREEAAKKAWAVIHPYAAKPKLTRAEVDRAKPLLDEFEQTHGATRYAGTIRDEIAALRGKLAAAAGPKQFNSRLALQVNSCDIEPSGQMRVHEIGRTPARPEAPIIIPAGSLWAVAPLDTAGFSNDDLRRLAVEVKRQEIPAVLLPRCGRITDQGIRSLRALTHLEFVSLPRTNVTDAATVDLARLRGLTALCISETAITNRGVARLAGLTKLERLDLRGTKITDGSATHLRRLTKLIRLQLDRTRVSDATLAALRDLKDLRFLSVQETRVTEAGVRALQAARPNLTIRR